jgi:hypothetical protein
VSQQIKCAQASEDKGSKESATSLQSLNSKDALRTTKKHRASREPFGFPGR